MLFTGAGVGPPPGARSFILSILPTNWTESSDFGRPKRRLKLLPRFLKPSWFGTVSSYHVATSAVKSPEK